ncbi:MAG: phosphodiester glycosidase family protein [Treponema sp.]|jgi:hypothetical protein|nr:phosphodiester glycosidase family protein [Treponema sp.]
MRKDLRCFVYLAFFAGLCVGCATVSPVSGDRERAVQFDSIGGVDPVWQSFASGIGYFAGKTAEPVLEFWALKVDLAHPSVRFVVGTGKPGEKDAGFTPEVNRGFGTTITGFARANDCIAALNTSPFSPVSARVGEARQIMGIAVSDGAAIASPLPPYDGLVIYADGDAAFLNQARLESPGRTIQYAAGGFFIVLEDGEITVRAASGTVRHPRSAAGLSEDGKTLYLLVADGRRLGSAGVTEGELGLLMRHLGSWNALNFDGGGSTALAMRYPDGTIRPVNIPIHKQIPGLERAVAVCLGIRAVDFAPQYSRSYSARASR